MGNKQTKITKTIYKPWGREVWIELNEKYCYKRIYINSGTRTSYQYHNHKIETNYIIEGSAEVWLENDDGIVEKKIMKAGDFFTIRPPKKHRVIAITNVILQEVSTPEVDDVFRISDDSGRGSGKIKHEEAKPAFCILSAGVGSRLNNFTKHINKALLPLNNKAIISHLIEKAPEDYDIVVILGYGGEAIKEYCSAAHPDRDFTFVMVDKYKGCGAGPGYSIKQAKKHLQRPFIWVAADTVITDDIPLANCNWLGLCPTSLPELYSTVDTEDGKVIDFKNKTKEGYNYAFIGLAGVYDYKVFWHELNNQGNDSWTDRQGKDHEPGTEIVSAYYNIDKYFNMRSFNFNWYDVGTVDNYFRAKKIFEDSVAYNIPKTNEEFLYKVGDTFIKLSSDKNFIKGRIDRSKNLKNLCPALSYKGENLYSYKWIDGKTLYDCNDIDIWVKFLTFMTENMWNPEPSTSTNIHELCLKFYKEKTLNRLKKFLSNRVDAYSESHNINGAVVEPIHSLLDSFKWDSICQGRPTKLFHGDLQFDNAIYSNDGNFYLIDWRQDFAGGDVGDVYYDLAKMYGGTLMSYKLMKNDDNFSCSVNSKTVTYSYESEPKLEEFKVIFEKWITDNGYDLKKIKAITSLIFLNMSPLHERKFGDVLFFKSKEMIKELDYENR